MIASETFFRQQFVANFYQTIIPESRSDKKVASREQSGSRLIKILSYKVVSVTLKAEPKKGTQKNYFGKVDDLECSCFQT